RLLLFHTAGTWSAVAQRGPGLASRQRDEVAGAAGAVLSLNEGRDSRPGNGPRGRPAGRRSRTLNEGRDSRPGNGARDALLTGDSVGAQRGPGLASRQRVAVLVVGTLLIIAQRGPGLASRQRLTHEKSSPTS